MTTTVPGITRMLARLASEQLRAAYAAALAGDPAAKALAGQAARTSLAAVDPWHILGWYDLCQPCTDAFGAWRDAKDPNDLSHLPVAALSLACPSGYDSRVRQAAWRETVSYQLLLTRALCTAGRH